MEDNHSPNPVDRSVETQSSTGAKRKIDSSPLYTILESQISHSVPIKKTASETHRCVILERPVESSDDEAVMNSKVVDISYSTRMQSPLDYSKEYTNISYKSTSDPPKVCTSDPSLQSFESNSYKKPWTNDEDKIVISFINEHEDIDFLTEGTVHLRSLFSQLQTRTMSDVRQRGHRLQRDLKLKLITESINDSLKMPNVGTRFATQSSAFTSTSLLEYLKKPLVINTPKDAKLKDQSVRMYISNLIQNRKVEIGSSNDGKPNYFI